MVELYHLTKACALSQAEIYYPVFFAYCHVCYQKQKMVLCNNVREWLESAPSGTGKEALELQRKALRAPISL